MKIAGGYHFEVVEVKPPDCARGDGVVIAPQYYKLEITHVHTAQKVFIGPFAEGKSNAAISAGVVLRELNNFLIPLLDELGKE